MPDQMEIVSFGRTGLKVSKAGVAITFSDKLDPELANDAESFEIRAADILWTQEYGSREYKIGQRGAAGKPQPGWTDMRVSAARLLPDGKTVLLQVVDLQAVHEMEIAIDVETTAGAEIRTKIFATVHSID